MGRRFRSRKECNRWRFPQAPPGSPPERIPVKAAYDPDDIAGLDFLDGYPGIAPYLRGNLFKRRDLMIGRFINRRKASMGLAFGRLGAACYLAWGAFHVYVAYQIYQLALANQGLVQGRLAQLALYMLSFALFAIAVALWGNWRNSRWGYWLNLLVLGWADAIWVITVVAPGYVPAARGLIPVAIYIAGAVLTTAGMLASRRPA